MIDKRSTKAYKLEKENKKLKEIIKQYQRKLNCKEEFSEYLSDDVEFVILVKEDYERLKESE